MRQQLVDAMVRMHRQPLEHVREVEPGTVAVLIGRVHEAHHGSRALSGEFTADEEPCLLPTAQGRIRCWQWLLSTPADAEGVRNFVCEA